MNDNYYVDMIEAARRALQRRNDARYRLEEFNSLYRPQPDECRRDVETNRKRSAPDDGPESWPGLFV
jgi:hypothetical protein